MPRILHLPIPRVRAHLFLRSLSSPGHVDVLVHMFTFKEEYPMKRSSWRWYLARGTMVASLSMLFFMMTAGPAQAWTQWWNTYSWDFNQHKFVGDPNCGNTTALPCFYWQEPHYTSINLYFYMDPSLSTGAGGYDFSSAVLQAFTQYNQVADWGPFMFRWLSGDPTFGGSYSMGILPCGKLGVTAVQYNSGIEYGWNPQSQRWENYSFIQNTATTLVGLH